MFIPKPTPKSASKSTPKNRHKNRPPRLAPVKLPKNPKKPPKNKKSLRCYKKHVARCLLIVFLLAGLAFVSYASIFAQTDRPAQWLNVKAGDSYQQLLLENPWQTHPLASKLLAKLYLRLQLVRQPTLLQTGVYHIPSHASLHQALAMLQQGTKTAMVKVQLIEGKTVKDLYQMLKMTDGVALQVLSPPTNHYTWDDVQRDSQAVAKALGIKDYSNLDGLFAPDTYYFAYNSSDKAILKRLYDRQQKLLGENWRQRAPGLPYKTPYELLIMASIIEKETGLPDERAQVASVFINRLNQGMRLQTDPTIIYGLFDRYDGHIYRSNIDEKTSYNTYQIDGLPPSPIAMPSPKALTAAAHPAQSEFLYFVATGTGGHRFSKTLSEHNQAVAQYRQTMAAQRDADKPAS